MSGGTDKKEDDSDSRRIRFYGINDLATRWEAPRVAEIASHFDPKHAPTNITDFLELHNVQQYLALGLLPISLPDSERDRLVALAPQMRSSIARFFAAINGSNFAALVTEVDFEYHGDLLELLGRGKVFERCDGELVLRTLEATGVHLGTMLADSRFVRAYDAESRAALLDWSLTRFPGRFLFVDHAAAAAGV